jgi:hypothetical protein
MPRAATEAATALVDQETPAYPINWRQVSYKAELLGCLCWSIMTRIRRIKDSREAKAAKEVAKKKETTNAQ